MCRTADLGGLQRRLDDTSDADRDFVLKLQDVVAVAVEAIGPEMGAASRIDKLRGDPHAGAHLTHRPFEHKWTPRSRPTCFTSTAWPL